MQVPIAAQLLIAVTTSAAQILIAVTTSAAQILTAVTTSAAQVLTDVTLSAAQVPSTVSLSAACPRIYRPAFSWKQAQNARIQSVIENERFGLVFTKTGSIISGTGQLCSYQQLQQVWLPLLQDNIHNSFLPWQLLFIHWPGMNCHSLKQPAATIWAD